MNGLKQQEALVSTGALSRWQRIVPVIALLLLPPIVAELLSGATRVTTIFVLLPEIGVWGCGALIIRTLARKYHKGWGTIVLLGIALAAAEELIIQQTSLAPLVGVDPARAYGRFLGVNWVYLLWALGYECIWVVVIPILLTELIFPEQRDEQWIGWRGLAIAAVAFLLAARAAWYLWTQLYAPRVTHLPPYHVPILATIIGLVLIAVLAAAAFLIRPDRAALPTGSAPRPIWVGLAAFVMAILWNILIILAYGAQLSLPVAIPLVGGLVLAGIALLLIRAWSASSGWQNAHRLALVFGVILATLLYGITVLSLSNALPVDRIGQVLFNLLLLVYLVMLSRRPQFHTA